MFLKFSLNTKKNEYNLDYTKKTFFFDLAFRKFQRKNKFDFLLVKCLKKKYVVLF